MLTSINEVGRIDVHNVGDGDVHNGSADVRDGDVHDGGADVHDEGADVRDGDVHDGVTDVHDGVVDVHDGGVDVRDGDVDVRAIFFFGTASLFNFLFLFNPSNSACKSLSKSLSSKCSAQRRKSFFPPKK